MKCDGHDKWRCCPLSRLTSSMSRLVLMNITISLLIISISAHAQLVIPEDVEIAKPKPAGNKIKIITPICTEGVFCGIGETIEGMIKKSFDKDSVVFSMQQEIGRKEITITIPRE